MKNFQNRNIGEDNEILLEENSNNKKKYKISPKLLEVANIINYMANAKDKQKIEKQTLDLEQEEDYIPKLQEEKEEERYIPKLQQEEEYNPDYEALKSAIKERLQNAKELQDFKYTAPPVSTKVIGKDNVLYNLSKTPSKPITEEDFGITKDTKQTQQFKIPDYLKDIFEKKAIEYGFPLPEEQPYFDEKGNIKRDITYSPYARQLIRFEEYRKSKEPILDSLRTKIEKKTKEIEQLEKEIELKKNNLKTPKDVNEYNNLIKTYNQKIKNLNEIEEYNKQIQEFNNLYQNLQQSLQKRIANTKRIEQLEAKRASGELDELERQELINLQRTEGYGVKGADISKLSHALRSFYNVFPHQAGYFLESLGILGQYNIFQQDNAYLLRELGNLIKTKLDLATNPYYEEDFLISYLPQAFGSGVLFYGTGLAGNTLKLPTYLLPLLTASLPQAAQGYKDAIRHGADEETALKSFLVNLGIGATEVIPVMNLFKRLDKNSGGLFSKLLSKQISKFFREGAEQGFEEFIQEVFQQFAQNANAKILYNVSQDLFENVGKGGAAGLISGFFFGASGAKLQELLESKNISESDKKLILELKRLIELKSKLKPIDKKFKPLETEKIEPKEEIKQLQEEALKEENKKRDTETYNKLTEQLKQIKSKNELVDLGAIRDIANNIQTQEVKTKIETLIKEAEEHNNKLIEKNQLTLENLSKIKYGTTDLNSLTEDQRIALINEYNEMKNQGITEFKQLKTTKPTIEEKEYAIQKPSTEEVLQRQQEETGGTRGERGGMESRIERIETSRESKPKIQETKEEEIQETTTQKQSEEDIKDIKQKETQKTITEEDLKYIRRAEDKFYIRTEDGFEEVKGKSIRLNKIDGDYFIFKSKDGSSYIVAEDKSGFIVSEGKTIDDAISSAEAKLLNFGKYQLEDTIKRNILEYGLSPRYTIEKPKYKRVSNKYYIWTKDGFEEVEGQPILLVYEGDFFLHKLDEDGGKAYYISEGKTGHIISKGDSKKHVINEANAKISKMGQERLKEEIETRISRFGLSPRYTMIEEDESNIERKTTKEETNDIEQQKSQEIVKSNEILELRKVSDKYYIAEHYGRGFEEVEGEPVKLDFEGDFFIYNPVRGHYKIYEANTGLLVADGSTRKEAINEANRKLKEFGQDKFNISIANATTYRYLSPRYKIVKVSNENIEEQKTEDTIKRVEVDKIIKVQDKYYAIENHQYKEVEGEPVKLDIDGDFFVYKDDKGYYRVVEGITGREIEYSTSKEKAIENANEFINKNGKQKIEDIINSFIIRNVISPRYKLITKGEGGVSKEKTKIKKATKEETKDIEQKKLKGIVRSNEIIELRKVSDKYYIFNYNENKFEEVEGEPVKLDFEGDFFIYKTPNELYEIRETNTGLLIASGSTREEAINEANKKLNKYDKDEFNFAIATKISHNFHSPRYKIVKVSDKNIEQQESPNTIKRVEIDKIKKVQNKYYAIEDNQYKEVKGKPVKLDIDGDFFVYKRKDNEMYYVCEGITGEYIEYSTSKEEAIEKANEFLNQNGEQKIEDIINAHILHNGVSPRYKLITKGEKGISEEKIKTKKTTKEEVKTTELQKYTGEQQKKQKTEEEKTEEIISGQQKGEKQENIIEKSKNITETKPQQEQQQGQKQEDIIDDEMRKLIEDIAKDLGISFQLKKPSLLKRVFQLKSGRKIPADTQIKTINLIEKFIEKNKYKFNDIFLAVRQAFGDRFAKEILPALKVGYKAYLKTDDFGNQVPHQFVKIHEYKLKHPYLKDKKVKFTEPKVVYWTREQIKSFGYSDSFIETLPKLKEGDFGYEPGKEKFAVEIAEATIRNPQGSEPAIIVSSTATPSAYAEGIIHALYFSLEKENPELLRRIHQWEERVREEAKKYGINIPQGYETFTQAMVFTHLGYADENPDIAELYEIPKDILEDFNKILNLGEISADALKEQSYRKSIRLAPDSNSLINFRNKKNELLLPEGNIKHLALGLEIYTKLKQGNIEKADIYPDWRKMMKANLGIDIKEPELREIWKYIKQNEETLKSKISDIKVGNYTELTPKQILMNPQGIYPTPIAIKDAKSILGDKFNTEFNKYKEQVKSDPELKPKDKTLEEGLLLESFARRVVAAHRLGINDIGSDLFNESILWDLRNRVAFQLKGAHKRYIERIQGTKLTTEEAREMGEDSKEYAKGNIVDLGVGLKQAFGATIDSILNTINRKNLERELGINYDPKLKKLYREFITAPVWFFDKEPQLKRVWDIIDRHFVRNVNEDTAYLKEEVWDNGKAWRDLSNEEKKEFLDALENYEYIQYRLQQSGQPLELLFWEEFVKEYKLSSNVEKFFLFTYRPVFETALEMVKDVDRYKIINATPDNPYLDKYFYLLQNKADEEKLKAELEKAKKEIFNDDSNFEFYYEQELLKMKEQGEEIDEAKALNLAWKNNIDARERLAEALISKKYAPIEGKVYFPATRLDKKYYLYATRKPNIEEQLIQNKGDDKFFTTDDSLIKLKELKKELENNGFKVKIGKFKEVGEEIIENVLTEADVLDLAIASGIENENPVIEKLIKTIRAKGFTRHFIHKKYIPGFEYNTIEFEKAIYNYINAVSLYKNRTIGGLELDKTIKQLKAQGILKHNSSQENYIRSLRNKIENSDVKVSQLLRAIASIYYLSLSPAYLSQQIIQPLNTLLPYLPIAAKELGLDTIEAEKSFGEALATSLQYWAWKVYDKLNRIQGKLTKATFGLDKEFLEIIRSLERQGVGKPLRSMELTGQEVDPKKHYITGLLDLGIKPLRWLATIVSIPGIAIEDFTRTIGIRAYYLLGKKAGLKGDELEDFISTNIAKSYGTASGRLSKPPGYYIAGKGKIRPLKKALQAVIESWLTFKNFAFMNYGQWGKVWRSLRKDNLLRPIIYKLGAQIGLGGLKYMMWTSSVLTLMSLIYGIFDIPEDPEEQYEKLFLNLNKLIPGLGDALYRGIASITFKVDLSTLFAQTSPIEEPFSNSPIEFIGGAPASAIMDITYGKAPRVLRGIQREERYKEVGVRLGRRKLIEPKDITEEEISKIKLGYTPLRISKAYREEEARHIKSMQYTDRIRKIVKKEIIPLIEEGKNKEAREKFRKIYEEMLKNNVLTDNQKKAITGVNRFISIVVLPRLIGKDREIIKKWKNRSAINYNIPSNKIYNKMYKYQGLY